MLVCFGLNKPAGLVIKYQFHEQGTKVAPGVLPALGGREHGWAEAGPSFVPGRRVNKTGKILKF